MRIKRLLLKLAIGYVRRTCKKYHACRDGCPMYDIREAACCFWTYIPSCVDLPEGRK